MAKVVIEEFHLTMRVPDGLTEHQGARVRETLDDRRFQAELRDAVRTVMRRHRSLSQVSFTLTR